MRLPWWIWGLICLAAVLMIASTSIGLVVALSAQDKAKELSARAAGGSQTCSGGNLAACDRVCVATASRLVIKTQDGRTATVYCRKSRVTAAIGGQHRPVGFVIPPRRSYALEVPAGITGPIRSTVPSRPAPKPEKVTGGTTPAPAPSPPAEQSPIPQPETPVPAHACQIDALGVQVCL